MSERIELLNRTVDWDDTLTEAFETPGVIGTQYSVFHSYSFMNRLLLFMQGARTPTGSYKRWPEVGRHVMKGEKGLVIVRPIIIKREDANGDETQFMRFKPVRGAFTLPQTDGEPFPDLEVPEWSLSAALDDQDVTMQEWNDIEGNAQGVSWGRNMAINPVAKFPLKTAIHELSHILHGHTEPGKHTEYLTHRGLFEVEAESAAFLAMRELGLSTPEMESESRGYLQHWRRDQEVPERSIKRIFKVADTLIRAGQVEVEEVAA